MNKFLGGFDDDEGRRQRRVDEAGDGEGGGAGHDDKEKEAKANEADANAQFKTRQQQLARAASIAPGRL